MPKKTKSNKETDIRQNKAWLKKSTPTKYGIEDTVPNITILITCEGQTEQLYFESFKVLTSKVKVINLQGQTKLKLVESTEAILKKSDLKYDEVWCVFDMDVKHGETEFADFDNAINKALSKKYKVAYSNDAFELWFYLHYHHTNQQNHRTFYYKELGKKWDINYPNDGKKYDFCLQIYDLLKDGIASQEEAIARAEKLYQEQNDLDFHKQNPVTLVHKLVELLNQNLRK